MTREDKIKMFANEIGDIKNEGLRKVATELIANADDYFFVVPASSSGKYHPQFDLGDGGLVRHTRCVAYFAKAMAESFNFNDEDTDLLIIAALAHDIKKQGNNTGHTVREHPLLASDYLTTIAQTFSEEVITNEQLHKICGAVVSHMGKWEGTREWVKEPKELYPMPETEFEKALQAADYVASRKEILGFNFRDTEVVGVIKEEEKPIEEMSLFELENYVLPFGKHRGKTLREAKPTGYLEWMLKQVDFSNKYSQDVVRAYFNKLMESVTSDGRDKVKEENKAYVTSNGPVVSQDEIDNLPF